MVLYARWVWTNTWAILTALALHSAIGQLAGVGDSHVSGGILDSIVSIAIGAPVIGGLVGWAQSRALARQLTSVSKARWITLTIAGTTLVLTAGALTTRLGFTVHFNSFEGEEVLAMLERAWSAVFLTQITGLLIGLLLGGPQAMALPAAASLRAAWVVANGAGWSLGMLLTALSIGFINPEAELRWIFTALFAGLALTGFSVGLFTGLVLKRLPRRSSEAAKAGTHPKPLPHP